MRRFVRWLPVLILVPLWGSGLILDRIAERVLLDSVHERLVTALHAHQRHVLTMLAHQQRGLGLFSAGATASLVGAPTGRKVPVLHGPFLASLMPEAVGCLLFDAKGQVVAHTGEKAPSFEIHVPDGLTEARFSDPWVDADGQSFYDVILPLRSDSRQVGTLACRSKNILSQSLAEHRQGLGLSGEVYLVSAKTRFMLTESRFIPNAIGRVKVDTIGVREALKMRNGIAPYPDYRGIPVIGTFLYLRDYDWVLLAEMDETEALAPLVHLRMVLGLSLGLISVAAGVVGWRYGRQLSADCAMVEEARDLAKEAEAQARALLRSAVDAIFEIDESGTVLLANESAHRMFGWPSGELLGRKAAILMIPEDGIKHEAGLRRYLETGESRIIGKCIEVTGLRRDGSRFPCELSVAAMTLPDGRRRFIGVHRDITERLQVESRSRMLAQAMRTAMDGIVLTDPQAVIIETNPAFDRMFGYERGELIGRHVRCLYPPAWLEKEFPAIYAATREGGWTGEVLGLRKDGSTFPRWVSTSPIRDPEGRLLGMLSVSRDITERKTMETHARRLEQLAAIGQLLGGISHEMRNPLFVLTGRLQLLKEKLAHQEYDSLGSDLQKIEDAAQRMTKIAQRFLFLAKPTPPTLQACSVQEVLLKVLDFLSNELMTHRIRVVREWEPALSKAQIWSDPQALHQIFLNLILNAMQAMAQAHGQGTLTVAAAISNGWIEVRIQDDGPGIPSEHHAKLFEPFFTTRAARAGTGLGLWTVRVALAELKGQVTFETEVERGTTFIVKLPVGTGPTEAPGT